MLRFLSRIRQKLIKQENMRKYIWYALGEILLVMVGILLALQINNWNEQRKQEEEAIRVMTDFANAIESNTLRDPAHHLAPAIQLDSVHYHIFNKTLKPDLLDKSRMVEPRDLIINPMLTTDFSGWFFNENINTILENERQFPEKFNRILFYTRRLDAAFKMMNSELEELKSMQRENLRYLRGEEWMYKTDEESFKQRIEFFHSNTRFRNHLRSYQESNESFLQQYEIFIKYQISVWIEFQKLIKEKSMASVFEQMEEVGYERANEVQCSDEIVKTLDEDFGTFYLWYPVYNNTTAPVQLYHHNPVTNENYVISTLEPGEYILTATSRDFPFLQVGTNNTCERQYAVSWDKIVVIDP